MAHDRRYLWLAGVLVVALGALAWGIPLATLLTIAAFLACPAAMFFGMGMMGRTQEGGMACGSGMSGRSRDEIRQSPLPGSGGTETPEAPPGQTHSPAVTTDGDPMTMLKRRLAAGKISLDEYERVAAAIGGAPAVAQPAAAAEGRVTHAAD